MYTYIASFLCHRCLRRFLSPNHLGKFFVSLHAVLLASIGKTTGNSVPALGPQARRVRLERLFEQFLLVRCPGIHVQALHLGGRFRASCAFGVVNLEIKRVWGLQHSFQNLFCWIWRRLRSRHHIPSWKIGVGLSQKRGQIEPTALSD